MRGILFILLATLIAAPVAAADREEVRWYDVELIIFTPGEDRFLDAEAWPEAPRLPETEEARLPGEPIGAQEIEAFQILTPDELQLAGAYRRLQDSSQFEPLVHIGWRQPGLNKNEALPVRITLDANGQLLTGERTPSTAARGALSQQADLPRLDGTVTVVLSRYLHLNTDLVYRIEADSAMPGGMFGEPSTQDPAIINLSTRGRSDEVRSREQSLAPDTEPFARGPRYLEFVVNDSRRMRSRELHYVDHPVLGVIALITPYEAP
ncbi:CsiV family protein [Thiohalomonas denitrificans]|uniref:Peptidoglycan-binding protein, CsiV n=1 Tax=Thiohalomonas denitrificans TaxID=415747 RepID=A0A1G5QCH3_9GAMM|nr:CsiV family protein [Thiohalomonas denitrificans]SCZ59575.1 Peptidoglycan-binding protein, CsiV [Thiohalomonas denitrificans]